MDLQDIINISFLFFLFLAVLYAIHLARKLKEKRKFFDDMGLTQVHEPDPGLKKRIMGLYPGDDPPDIDIFRLRELRRGNAMVYVMDFLSQAMKTWLVSEKWSRHRFIGS